MVNVIGVRFENAGKLYFFNPGALWPTPGDFVIVETTRGIEFGEVVTEVREIDDEKLASPLRPVVRIATEEDVRHDKENKAAEKEAFLIGQKKIADHKLDMKLVSVEYTFDNKTILFYFTANGRVDFRSLVKDLAGVFKTRIELRQIGVRDEAKMIGGLGPCGRPICCGTFLGDFQPVSIKMAKEQSLSLNPIKISGVCGRLMCCLKYEQDTYEEIRKSMPKEGKEVLTPDGIGVVSEVKIIAETVKVRLKKGDSFEIKEYPASEVQRLSPQIPQRPEMPKTENAPAESARPERANRRDRKGNDNRADKAGDAPVKPEKGQKPAAAPVENAQETPAVQETPAAQDAPVAQDAPAAQDAPKAQEAAPAVNPWKQALEAAMLRASQGQEEPKAAEEKPAVEETPVTAPETTEAEASTTEPEAPTAEATADVPEMPVEPEAPAAPEAPVAPEAPAAETPVTKVTEAETATEQASESKTTDAPENVPLIPLDEDDDTI